MQLAELFGDTMDPSAVASLEITGLTAHSSAVEPGFLFAALTGTRARGADHIAEATARGATAVLAAPEVRLPEGADAVLVSHPNPRACLSEFAARFYAPLPKLCVAVTGTDGKTSVAWNARELASAADGRGTGYIGTLGVLPEVGEAPALTTPEPVALMRTLQALRAAGAERVALEASSHGLAQHRVDGLRFRAACFTGLGRDHADYHASEADYLATKLRLFSELLEEGGTAVLAAGKRGTETAVSLLKSTRADVRIVSYGAERGDFALVSHRHTKEGSVVRLRLGGEEMTLALPLFAPFQAENLLAALALAQVMTGQTLAHIAASAHAVAPVPGRLERLAVAEDHRLAAAEIFIDYAHNPNGTARVLQELAARRDALGATMLAVVLGAGGDRDRGKRAAMGEAAARFADVVFITDDNPRGEDASDIRAAVLAGAAGGRARVREVKTGRRDAIEQALSELGADGMLAVLGKGDEATQEIGCVLHPFSDRDVVGQALAAS